MCVAAVKYDPGKEKKEEIEKKQRKLNEIEEARKKKDTSDARQYDTLPWLLINMYTQLLIVQQVILALWRNW